MDGFGLVLLFWSAWHLHNRHSTHVGWHFLCLVVPTIVPTFSRTWSSGHLLSLSRDEHVKFICYTCGTNGTNGTNIHDHGRSDQDRHIKATVPGMTGDRYGLDLEIVI